MELKLRNLGKRYSSVAALDDVELDIASGELVALLGPSGSGKTTLLRVVAGLLEPEQGEVAWRGESARRSRDDFHSDLAYLGHEPPLKGDLTGRENLHYSTAIRRAVTPQEIDAALGRTGAQSFADRATRMLSAGQRRRVALAGMLLASATLWLLDEPTTNLDAEGQRLVATLVAEQLERGGIVVAAVHQGLDLAAERLVSLELGT
jgi:heme exporter protein A